MAWQDERSAWQSRMKVERDPETGMYRATFTIHDQYREVNGQWANVVEEWADTIAVGMTDEASRLGRHKAQLALSGGRRWWPRIAAEREYVEIGPLEEWTGIGWREVGLGDKVREGQAVTWEGAHIQLSYFVTWRKLGMRLVLKDAQAPRRYRFPIALHDLQWKDWRLSGAEGVTGRVLQPRLVSHRDSGFLWPGRALKVSYRDGYLEFEVDTSGLAFPVEIANTEWSTQPDATAGKDTQIYEGGTGLNYGTADRITGRGPGIEQAVKILLEFDCSARDASDTCNSATLYLWNDDSSTSCTLTVYSIAVGNEAWPEGVEAGSAGGAGDCCWAYLDQDSGNETNWAGAAGLATSGTDYEAVSIGTVVVGSTTEGDEHSGALTAARVEAWFGDPNTNYGMLIVSDTDNWTNFRSSDHATAGERPKLVVDYTAAAPGGNPWYYYAQQE